MIKRTSEMQFDNKENVDEYVLKVVNKLSFNI